MQIAPFQALPVSYVASIPGDTTLYYVQAVLRNTASSAVLQTINLTRISSTPNRYTGSFSPNVITDSSGLGSQVDITISVYTDSGHTTLSPNYQILQINYTVLQPWIQNLGTGGGLNIDYDKLQKMFDGSKVANTVIGNEKEIPEVDYDRVNESILGATESTRAALSEELRGHVTSISKMLEDVSKSSNESNTAHGARLQALESRIQGFEKEMKQSTALSSKERLQAKTELSQALKDFRDEMKKANESGSKENEKRLKKTVEEIQQYLNDNLSEKEIKMVYSMQPQKKEKPKGYSPEDVMSLLR